MDHLEGLKGGQRQMWLRDHRGEILEYLDKHGVEVTMKRYKISKKDVLERLVRQESRPYRHEFTRLDRVEMKANTALADVRDIRKETQEMQVAFQHFVESVGEQLAMKFFLPLLQSAIKVDPSFELKADDRLNIDDLLGRKPAQLGKPKEYDVVDEASKIARVHGRIDDHRKPECLSCEDWEELSIKIKALYCDCENLDDRLPDRFHEAVGNQEWKQALFLYMAHHSKPWLPYKHLEFSWDQDELAEFAANAKKWIAETEELLKE